MPVGTAGPKLLLCWLVGSLLSPAQSALHLQQRSKAGCRNLDALLPFPDFIPLVPIASGSCAGRAKLGGGICITCSGGYGAWSRS